MVLSCLLGWEQLFALVAPSYHEESDTGSDVIASHYSCLIFSGTPTGE